MDDLLKDVLEAEKKLREKKKKEKEKKEEKKPKTVKGILMPGEIALLSNQLVQIWNELIEMLGNLERGRKIDMDEYKEIVETLQEMRSKVRFTELYIRWKKAMELVYEVEKLL